LAPTLLSVNTLKLFEEMQKTRVAPALRELGLRGSKQDFRLPNDNGDYALFGFQTDSWDGTTRFTANVAFYRAQRWQEARERHGWLPAAPTARSLYAVEPALLQGWTERIGALMDPPHDHWWTIRTEDDVPVVAEHVVSVVRDAVLPQLRARLSGSEPPPLPSRESGPVAACPAPTCARPPVPWLDGADLGSVGTVIAADADGDAGLDAAQQQMLDLARQLAVPRTQAWKVLHISRDRLDTYADRIGAGPALSFAQLLAVDLLSTDDLLIPSRWPEAAEAVADWAVQLPDADRDAALVLAEDAVAVLPLSEALAPDDPDFALSVVQPLMPATQHLLEEIGSVAGSD
jgi:hypothetical protein